MIIAPKSIRWIQRSVASAFAAVLLVTIADLPVSGAEVVVDVQEPRVWTFDEEGVSFNNQFPGARVNECTRTGSGEFQILIKPENSPINNSAWYAFEVVAKESKTITVTLTYEGGRHRYRPQVSTDGAVWAPLDPERWTADKDENTATLQLDIGTTPLRVAGQEMVGTQEIRDWTDQLAEKDFVRKARIGESILGQPIDALSIGSQTSRRYVFILGRQHPPEITGTLGLFGFVETLAGDSDLARDFRQHFRTIVIPLMNPDGVDRGHWRHNLAGVDLNRDWMTFVQPETEAARKLFTALAGQKGAQAFLLLDFHSTHRDVFYTQKDEHPTVPEDFTAKWLGALQERFPDYNVRRSASHSERHVTSKGWGYETFGIPSITYEFGDNTDRDFIRESTAASCEEMMRLLLAEVSESIAGSERRGLFRDRMPSIR